MAPTPQGGAPGGHEGRGAGGQVWPHAWAGGAGGKAELCDRWQHSAGTALDTHLLTEAPRSAASGGGTPPSRVAGKTRSSAGRGTCHIRSCDRRGGPRAPRLRSLRSARGPCTVHREVDSARGQGAVQGCPLPSPRRGSRHRLAEVTSSWPGRVTGGRAVLRTHAPVLCPAQVTHRGLSLISSFCTKLPGLVAGDPDTGHSCRAGTLVPSAPCPSPGQRSLTHRLCRLDRLGLWPRGWGEVGRATTRGALWAF